MLENLKINKESFAFQVLKRMYDWEGRYYHTYSHIEEMFDFASKDPNFTVNVAFAIMYHDAIFIPEDDRRNEIASAAFFKAMIMNGGGYDLFTGDEYLNSEEGCDSLNIDKVVNLIVATKYHRFTGDPENDLLMKADLLCFHYKFKRYFIETLIRKEYKHLSDYYYLNNRIQFLENLKKSLKEDGVLEEYSERINTNIDYLKNISSI